MIYDFDMHSVLPLAAQRGARTAGREGDLSGQQIALFRDPRVADALRAADPEIQQLFLDSGFGMTSWASDLPDGRFRERDSAARNRVISRFAANLRKAPVDLRQKDWGGFALSRFTDSYLSARALPNHVRITRAEDPVPLVRPRPPRRDRPQEGLMARFLGLNVVQKVSAMGLIAVTYLLAVALWHIAEAAHLARQVQAESLMGF
ncbi:MAG: hypothetical protein GYB53_04270 [Rhodobacteraceae bacterium]|nr:hypothetical protein [Paracoccaceae bacterium]MBR9821084.1 hypothetical protein [Paracoccaceae bacterium]